MWSPRRRPDRWEPRSYGSSTWSPRPPGSPLTAAAQAGDYKICYPGATPITQRITGDITTRKILVARLVGHVPAQISKRIDIFATTIFYGGTVDDVPDLDLSYTPPLGSPYDASKTLHSDGSTPNVTDLAKPSPRQRATGQTYLRRWCTLMPWATMRPISQGLSGASSPGQSNSCPGHTACRSDPATS